MGLIQASRQSTGGGGGGLNITGFAVDTHTQTSNFVSGGVVISLSQTPIDPDSIQVDYDGQRILNSNWSYAAGAVTILFADPYIDDPDSPYDEDPVFQITYCY